MACVLALACLVAGQLTPTGEAQFVPPPLYEAVAVTGDPAPGIPGATITYVSKPQIDAAGRVLFAAELSGPGIDVGNDMGVFYGAPGNVQKLIQEGDTAPDMPEGVFIASLHYSCPSMSETGWIAVTPDISGVGIVPGVNDRVLLVGPPGNLRKVLQAGDPAPGCAPGELISVDWFAGRLSDNATILIGADLTETGYYADHAFWIGPRDNIALVYRDGMPVPGQPGMIFRGVDGIVHNDSGEVLLAAWLGFGRTDPLCDSKWLGGPGALAKITCEGDPVPGMDEGVVWSALCGVGSTETNAWGDLVEEALVYGPGITAENNRVLFVGNRGDIFLVAQEGDPVPEAGPGVSIWGFGNCWINNRHEAFYRVLYQGDGITEQNRSAMYFGPLGHGVLSLRDGDPAPTFPPGVTLWRVVSVPGLTAMNDVGDIIAPTQIAGPGVTDENKAVLWLRHRVLQRWIPLLRGGDAVDGRIVHAPTEGDFGSAYCNKTGGADGLPQSLNDQGMLAIKLAFTDGHLAIYRISPPVFGDADADGDTDFDDWLLMEGCWTGPGGGAEPGCAVFDLDADGDVDLADHALFAQLVRGE